MSVRTKDDTAVIAHAGGSRLAEVAEAVGEVVSRGSVAGFVAGVGSCPRTWRSRRLRMAGS